MCTRSYFLHASHVAFFKFCILWAKNDTVNITQNQNTQLVFVNGISKIQQNGVSDENEDNLVVPGKSGHQKAPWLLNCRAAIIPADHHFELELDSQCSFLTELAKIICCHWLPLVELRLIAKGRSWMNHLQLGLSFKRQLTFWNYATSKYIKIIDVNWCHAMPATSSKAMNLLRQVTDLQAVQHGLLPML